MVVHLRIDAPDWRKAKCRGTVADNEYDPFFHDMPEALDFCNGAADGQVCPIRHECMLFALTNNERFGVWGGTSELTRRALRKRWPLRGKEPRPEWHWMTEDDALDGLKDWPLSLLNDLFDDEEEDA